ncbi:MAG: malonyl-ACP O-methyltransferase BioC [Oligosphaeraceae bacterium]
MADLPDKNLVRQRFARSLDSYDQAAEVQTSMAAALMEKLLATAGADFPRVLEAGCGTGVLTSLLERSLRYQELLLVDLVPECEKFHRGRPRSRFLAGDMESLPLPEGVDLCVSNAVFQWFWQPAAFLKRLAGALRPGGVLAFTTFGSRNLQEVAALTRRGLEYPSRERWEAMLRQEGYEILHQEESLRSLRFPRPADVLRHLKATGVTATGKGEAPWNRERIRDFQEEYARRFAEPEGQVRLTYHPLLFLAQRHAP